MDIKVVDLFSGCGGLSLGFQNAGFDVVAAADNWKPAVEVYRKNFSHPIFDLDLGNVSKSVKTLSEYKPDLIIGGPPCQDFSHAGKRDESRGRADLTYSFSQIVTKIKPKYFVMENVDQIQRYTKLDQVVKLFKKAGYGLTSNVLDASLFGVPQRRKRFIMVGVLGAEDGELQALFDSRKSAQPMTVRDYFGKSLGIENYYRHPRNYSRRAVFSIDEPSPTIRGVNRPIPSGYPGHHLDTEKDLSKVRPLTTQERGMVQTFPKNFQWVGTKTDLEQIIGNAVPVNLGQAVAEVLRDYIQGVPLRSSLDGVAETESLFSSVR